MSSRSLRGYAAFAEMPAPSGVLWSWLTDPSLLRRWYAESVELAPRAGGRFTARLADGTTFIARVGLAEPARRLRLDFESLPAWPGPACITEDWIIDARPEKVVLRVIGEGVPAGPEWGPWLRLAQSRWTVNLARLKRLLLPAPSLPAGGPR